MAHIGENQIRHLSRCYCRSLCRLYGAGVISDEHMEALVCDIRALQDSSHRAVWSQLAVLPPDSLEQCINRCAARSSLSPLTIEWLMAFVRRGHAAAIPRSLNEMEHFIITVALQVPESLPMTESLICLARRSLQRYYRRQHEEAYVEVRIHAVTSSMRDQSMVPAVAAVFEAMMGSL